jgi:hypothetical protein
MFTRNVCAKLKFYVYRLIDPRNGETFYVGKGKDNRVFQHAKAEPGAVADELTEKLKRIREINNTPGFEVSHVIHRHGMDENTAFEVEAALIDAYPEATNLVRGPGSDEHGLMHSKQIIQLYEAPKAVFKHKALLICINQLARSDIYESVRYEWRIDHLRADTAEIVLAVHYGVIVGAFIVDGKWLSMTVENAEKFPGIIPAKKPKKPRWGFVGHKAPDKIAKLYLQHRAPQKKKGEATPFNYINC